jgi:hypothetical protein
MSDSKKKQLSLDEILNENWEEKLAPIRKQICTNDSKSDLNSDVEFEKKTCQAESSKPHFYNQEKAPGYETNDDANTEEILEEIDYGLFAEANLNFFKYFKQNPAFKLHCSSSFAPLSVNVWRIPIIRAFKQDLTLIEWLGALLPLSIEETNSYLEEQYQHKSAIFKSCYIWSEMLTIKVLSEKKDLMHLLKQDITRFLMYLCEFKEITQKFSEEQEERIFKLFGNMKDLKDYQTYKKRQGPSIDITDPYHVVARHKEHTNLESENGYGYTYYLAWNTNTPIDTDSITSFNNPKKKSVKLSRKMVEHCYSTNSEGAPLTEPPSHLQKAKFSRCRKALVLLALLNYLHFECNINIEILKELSINIEWKFSSNPIFWNVETLLNTMRADPKSCIHFLCPQWTNRASSCLIRGLGYAINPNKLDKYDYEPLGVKIGIFEQFAYVSQMLILYSETWNDRKESLVSLFRNRNQFKTGRVDKFQIPFNLEDALANLELDFRRKDGQENNLQNDFLNPLLYYMHTKQTTKKEAESLIYNLLKRTPREDERSNQIRLSLGPILQALETAEKFQKKMSEQLNTSYKERREALGAFLYEFKLKGIDVTDNIYQLKCLSCYQEMRHAMKIFLMYTMGPEFILHTMLYNLVYDEKTILTKMLGIFIRGQTNCGKSIVTYLYFLPFVYQIISNASQNILDKETLSNNSVDAKVQEIRPNYLFAEEFTVTGFGKKNSLPVQDFDNLFDMRKSSRALNLKWLSLLILTKAPLFLVSHNTLNEFCDNYHPSFFSRFGAVVDMDSWIFFKNFVLPNKNVGETEDKYYQRLWKEKLIDRKPVFPFTIDMPQVEQKMLSENILAELYEEEMIPKLDKATAKFRINVPERNVLLQRSHFSKDWTKFPKLDEIQASWIFHDVLVDCQDKLFCSYSNDAKESLVPLIPKSIHETSSSFLNYEDFICGVLKPSLFLKYYEKYNTPQEMLNQIINDVGRESCLISQRSLSEEIACE